MKILIADAMSDKAVDILKSNKLDVDVKTDLKKEELQAIIGGYDALIVRSATKVTKEIIEKADKLKVIGRAGIGVDNVDVEAATEKGYRGDEHAAGECPRRCGARPCPHVCPGQKGGPRGPHHEGGEVGEEAPDGRRGLR